MLSRLKQHLRLARFILPCVALVHCTPELPAHGPESLAIHGVGLFDGTGPTLQPDRTVIINDTRILRVLAASDFDPASVGRVIDGSGHTLIPGLWDMHVHVQEMEEDQMSLFPAWGVTSVRDMGDPPDIVLGRRDAIEQGKLIGPRIKTAVFMIDNPFLINLIEQTTSGATLAREQARRINVQTAEEARAAVRRAKEVGADFVKLHMNESRETYFALADEARKQNLHFAGHDPLGEITLADWIEAGQQSIEHLDGSFGYQFEQLTAEQQEATIQGFLDSGLHFVPTLGLSRAMASFNGIPGIPDRLRKAAQHSQAPYISDALWAFWESFFNMVPPELPGLDSHAGQLVHMAELHRKGVPFMPGTDIGIPLVFPGYSLHDELALFVEHLGMTPGEALQSATRIPAEFFGLQDNLGTIEAGKIADLVLLTGNPLQDITHTRSITAVVLDGEYYDRSALDGMLSSARTAQD